jgi:hypothetical protein
MSAELQAMAWRYPAKGICIYCGATKYSALSEKPLTTEHIMPVALNGDLELPESSCLKCERITGRTEQLALQGVYRGLRARLGYKHRHKKEQPTTLPVFIPVAEGKDTKLDIPVDEYPHVHFFLSLGTPGRLLGVPSGAEFGPAHRWMRAQASDISEPVTSKKLKSFATPSLDLHSFCRMLAKIGHSYASAELMPGAFSPLLLDLILRDSKDVFHLVGGYSGEPDPPVKEPYLISMETSTVFDNTYLVAKIRPFANVEGSPHYRIVVGIRN